MFLRPFILTLAAGLATVLGALIVFFTKGYRPRLLAFTLTFAASIMITVSITELIPEALFTLIKHYDFILSFILIISFILIGFIISFLINKIIPEGSNHLYKIGLFAMIALMFHNLPEGIITFMAGYKNITLGLSLAFAIALHNIPEGISIAMPIYYATHQKSKAIFLAFLSGLSEPFGAILTFFFLKPVINNFTLSYMLLVTAGLMLHIAITKLIPEASVYHYPKTQVLAYSLGTVIMILSVWLF